MVYLPEKKPDKTLRLFLTTGILDGYIMFSAFSLDTALLYQRGQLGLAILYTLIHTNLISMSHNA